LKHSGASAATDSSSESSSVCAQTGMAAGGLDVRKAGERQAVMWRTLSEVGVTPHVADGG